MRVRLKENGLKKTIQRLLLPACSLFALLTPAIAGEGGPYLAGKVVSVNRKLHSFVMAVDTYYPKSGKQVNFKPKRIKTVLVGPGTHMNAPFSKFSDIGPGDTISVEAGKDAPGKPVTATAIMAI